MNGGQATPSVLGGGWGIKGDLSHRGVQASVGPKGELLVARGSLITRLLPEQVRVSQVCVAKGKCLVTVKYAQVMIRSTDQARRQLTHEQRYIGQEQDPLQKL